MTILQIYSDQKISSIRYVVNFLFVTVGSKKCFDFFRCYHIWLKHVKNFDSVINSHLMSAAGDGTLY